KTSICGDVAKAYKAYLVWLLVEPYCNYLPRRLTLAAALFPSIPLLHVESTPGTFGVPGVQRHRQEPIGAALHKGGQPLVHLRVVFAQIDAPLAQDRLHVQRHLLPGPLRRLGQDVERQHEHITDRIGARARPLPSPRSARDLAHDRAAQLQLRAPRHQLPLPLDGGCRAAGRLRHHADRDVEQHLRVGLVLGAELQQLRVQLRSHLGRQQVRPAHVRHLAQALEALLDERVGPLRAAEQYSNNTSPLRQVAPAREHAQVAERVRVVLARGQHQPAQGGHPRVQAGLPVPLPVRPAALARAVQMGTVVAALEGFAGLGEGGGGVAPRVPALEVVPVAGRLRRVERHAPGDPCVQSGPEQIALGRWLLLPLLLLLVMVVVPAALVGTAARCRRGGGGAADRHRATAVVALARAGRITFASAARLHRFDLQRVQCN
uniref:Uncharacterized protein n=1 Tax=Anopheles melas TaxID=34690 RepID=A0A182U255_9DIPT